MPSIAPGSLTHSVVMLIVLVLVRGLGYGEGRWRIGGTCLGGVLLSVLLTGS